MRIAPLFLTLFLASAGVATAQDPLPGILDRAEMEALLKEARGQAADAQTAMRERAKLLGYSDAEIERAMKPSMVRKGHFTVTLADGTQIRFPWFRIGFAENVNATENKRGIDRGRLETNKGGVRLHKGVFGAEVYALALKMDAKLAITGDASAGEAFRGAKGGIGAGQVVKVGTRYKAKVGDWVDPASKVLDRAEMMRSFGRGYMAGGARVGIGSDIQAGDVNTKAAEMKVLSETYGRGQPSIGVSGKEVITAAGEISPKGGIEYRAVSTGEGVWMSSKLAGQAEGLDFKRATVASQGWGEVGKGFGMAAVREGSRVIAIQELWMIDGEMRPGLLQHPKGANATHAEVVSWLKDVEALRAGKHDLRSFRAASLRATSSSTVTSPSSRWTSWATTPSARS